MRRLIMVSALVLALGIAILPSSASAATYQGGFGETAFADATYTLTGVFVVYPRSSAYVTLSSGSSNSCYFGAHAPDGTGVGYSGQLFPGQSADVFFNDRLSDVSNIYVQMQCDSTGFVSAGVYTS